MPTPTIIKGEEYFNTIIYEGNGGGQRVGRFVPFTDSGTIDNSCIFNGATAGARVGRTPSSNGSGTILTFSAWVKRGRLGIISTIFISNNYSSVGETLEFNASDQLNYYCIKTSPGSYDWNYITNRTFEDTSKWYHIYVRRDTTDSTAADRVQIYVDGEKVTSWNTETQAGSNQTGWMNQTTYENTFGNTNSATYVRGVGYLAEVNMIDGSNPAISTFGEIDTSTGRWVPKTLTGITYGTNGFRCKFQDSSALGDDTSGNENDLTATNLASTDQTTDSPTQNHATLQGTGGTLSEGNLKLVTGNSDYSHHNATLKPRSGKYYAEFTCDSMGRSEVGVVSSLNVPYASNTTRLPSTADGSVAGYMYYGYDGKVYYNSSNSYDLTYATYTSTDIIGIALDLDNHTVQFFKNNSSQGTISLPNGNYTFAMGDGATGYSGGWTANFGQKSFSYTPPTGFLALQQDNLPETDKGISSMVWAKNRDNGNRGHQLYDSSRGPLLTLYPNGTNAESTNADSLQKFLKGGFSAEDFTGLNEASESHVAWNWVANAGTTASNTDGSTTTTTQANTTAGFSIVEFTTPSGGPTITLGHGLTQAPEWFFFRNKGATGSWLLFHKSAYDASNGGYSMVLNSDAANAAFNTEYGSTAIYPQAPTATTFALRNPSATAPNSNYIAYCWHGVENFSKFNSYIGNGNSNGPFIYIGFKPAWLMIKRIDSAGYHWCILDNRRNPFNPADNVLKANLSAVEDDDANMAIDLLSNGFKIRGAGSDGDNINASGGTYIYMAFAENPFIGDGVSPVTAR